MKAQWVWSNNVIRTVTVIIYSKYRKSSKSQGGIPICSWSLGSRDFMIDESVVSWDRTPIWVLVVWKFPRFGNTRANKINSTRKNVNIHEDTCTTCTYVQIIYTVYKRHVNICANIYTFMGVCAKTFMYLWLSRCPDNYFISLFQERSQSSLFTRAWKYMHKHLCIFD